MVNTNKEYFHSQLKFKYLLEVSDCHITQHRKCVQNVSKHVPNCRLFFKLNFEHIQKI